MRHDLQTLAGNPLVEFRPDAAPTNLVSQTTWERIQEALQQGLVIIVGNNPAHRLKTVYGHPKEACRKLCQTNNRHHGKSIRTIWAVPSR